MTLDDLLSALRRHRLAALLASGLVLLLSVAAALLPPDRYTATASIIAKPVLSSDVASYSSAVSVLMPTLAAYVTSDANNELVRGSMPSDLRESEVEVEARAEPGTGLLTITTTSTRRDAVAPFANAASFALRKKQASDVAGVELAVLDEALEPTVPSGPPRAAVLLGGLLLAALAGLSAALLARALSTRAELADLVPSRTGVPVLGELPRVRLRGRSLREQKDPRLVEALQRVRIGLEAADATGGRSSLAITSLHAGEGKSSVSAALVQALAEAGQRVVLVDADLRRPTQHEAFGCALVPGLADAGAVDPGSLLQQTGEPTLRLLSAGVPDSHPLQVLDGALPRTLAVTAADGAVAVLDTPPLESVAETLRVLTLADAALLVVDSRRVDLQDLERSVNRLRTAGVRVVGIVLNHVRRAKRNDKDHYYLPDPGPGTATPPPAEERVPRRTDARPTRT